MMKKDHLENVEKRICPSKLVRWRCGPGSLRWVDQRRCWSVLVGVEQVSYHVEVQSDEVREPGNDVAIGLQRGE